MSTQTFHPFILLTPTLFLIPTPIAMSIQSYRTLYRNLHANAAFCTMGFGSHFPPREWSDPETETSIRTRDVARCWGVRGMGDFAMSLRTSDDEVKGRELGANVVLVDGEEYVRWVAKRGGLEGVEWIGYAGIRDATTTSLPELEEGESWPDWREMVELRYGVAPDYWGKGLARIGADAVMLWGVKEMGVKRYIAETEKENVRSGKVLGKMGFKSLEGVSYFKEESEDEWVLSAEDLVQRLGKL
ncbi:Acyl-CoA N-acyltransferases (Nat) [Glarea lozoyensis ATCC 20868]|uniref:Acyl-CoA N-acyltransferases (Nat) n=1 Tax=Glarea lozoyensis (strain ATCC 20868 / MF5171) TaxID=1116229 RepID=S3DX42_GLAL2|nr:Acyl-CoA N-acyltransferases (Nat) [Glarea lozoyensis ATCC 20868]EPE36536.1 Acyl-CoA N-acyltransferases (Nat) [Glarea lozoyensis ATCC 20868]